MVAAAKTTSVNRSASIGLEEATLDSITAAATKVGAPTGSTVTTGGSVQQASSNGQNEYLPYSVTFSWSEEV